MIIQGAGYGAISRAAGHFNSSHVYVRATFILLDDITRRHAHPPKLQDRETDRLKKILRGWLLGKRIVFFWKV